MNDENSILLNENCDKLKCNFLISKLNDNDKSILFIVDIINLNGIKFTLFNITLMDGNEGKKIVKIIKIMKMMKICLIFL